LMLASVGQDTILKILSYLEDTRYYLILYLQDTFKKYLYLVSSRYFKKVSSGTQDTFSRYFFKMLQRTECQLLSQ
jgi:hypothetical protein